MAEARFESQCGTCDQRITTRDGGATWKHDKAPTTKHHAYAHREMKQL